MAAYLDWLHEECHDVRVALQLCLQGWDVIVRDVLKARHEGTEATKGLWVRGAGDGGQGTAPEVVRREKYDCLVLGHTLDVVTPPPEMNTNPYQPCGQQSLRDGI